MAAGRRGEKRNPGASLRLGASSAIIQEAEQRALRWLATQAPPGARPLALAEISSKDRRGAYLHVVAAAPLIVSLSNDAVWVAAGPVAVDAETWTLVLSAARCCTT